MQIKKNCISLSFLPVGEITISKHNELVSVGITEMVCTRWDLHRNIFWLFYINIIESSIKSYKMCRKAKTTIWYLINEYIDDLFEKNYNLMSKLNF